MSEILRVRFDNSLSGVRDNLSAMGAKVDSMVAAAVAALLERDGAAAKEVMRRDDEVDALDLGIEEQCLRLLWSQQPVAADLRVVGTAMKAITDLERIGDHAVDIAKIALELNEMLPPPPVVDLARMSEAALHVLHEALRGFASEDMSHVKVAVAGDDTVDALYARARADLDAATARDPENAIAYNRLSIVALYLERVADHAVNIAERVAYLLTGDFAQLARSHNPPV
jgi:phosphate transport system protein